MKVGDRHCTNTRFRTDWKQAIAEDRRRALGTVETSRPRHIGLYPGGIAERAAHAFKWLKGGGWWPNLPGYYRPGGLQNVVYPSGRRAYL